MVRSQETKCSLGPSQGFHLSEPSLGCRNWAEYRVGVQKALFEPNTSIKLKVNDDLGVHSRGNLAWATFTFGADITSKQGATSHLDGRWTMVLEKRAKGWIVVHEHVSAPLGGS
jgi:ketosteroid isomerase-like protein